LVSYLINAFGLPLNHFKDNKIAFYLELFLILCLIMNEVNSISELHIDSEQIRADFPILSRTINGKPLIYFDSGATAQKPQQVIDAVSNYYAQQNANIHRGVHTLSQEITVAYEKARGTVQKHLNAEFAHEIIFTKGTTESISLVAYSFGKKFISAGDEVIVSEMDHHSNILPWQQLCEDKGAILKVLPINDAGELCIDELQKLITSKTKLLAVTHVSNTLGTINPIKEIIRIAHAKNVAVLVDGAQAVPHMEVDVRELDADFYCFSGHKLFGPTGIGVLYGKEKWLNPMPPYQVGGGTIKTVTFKKTEYADLPLKFEAGTPHMEGVIGLEAALNYVNKVGLKNIAAFEHILLDYATAELKTIPGVKIIGTAKEKASVISFVVDGLHALDVGTILDQLGIAVRTGHHCTQPLMEHYCIQGTIRVSLAFYNTVHEIDELIRGLKRAIDMLR
jgi:cysteine desulfurase/selenocysteine lyase